MRGSGHDGRARPPMSRRGAECGVASGARLFLRAALDFTEPADLEAPEARIAVALFSLGAVASLARCAHLAGRDALAASVEFASEAYGLPVVDAATLVGSLQQLADETCWGALRDVGEKAMSDWLSGADERAPERLARRLVRFVAPPPSTAPSVEWLSLALPSPLV
jgi:hypothetical protein